MMCTMQSKKIPVMLDLQNTRIYFLKKHLMLRSLDCRDAVQGDLAGTVSQGEYIIDIMNKLGYKYAVLGNHEFDYGMKQLSNFKEHETLS